MKVVAISDRHRDGSGAGAASLDWHASARAALLRARTDDRPLGRAAVDERPLDRHRRHRARDGRPTRLRSRRTHGRLRIALHSGVVRQLVARGAAWLAAHANADGGWGDTPDSRSNISTTALAWGALNVAPSTPAIDAAARKAEAWLDDVAGGVDGGSLRRALDARYG